MILDVVSVTIYNNHVIDACDKYLTKSKMLIK